MSVTGGNVFARTATRTLHKERSLLTDGALSGWDI